MHPRRGLVIYVSHNNEHPEGVVRLVGMDGINVSRSKVKSIDFRIAF